MEYVGFFTLVYSILLFVNHHHVSSVTTWNMPRPVTGYEFYSSLVPLKFLVPPGLANTNFSFQVARSDPGCAKKKINILIQNGGLPLVKQTNLSFPTGFIVPSAPTIFFSMEVDHLVSFSIVRPPPGPWFVISYSEGIEEKIKQKGLDTSLKCLYSLLSRMELGNPVKSRPIETGHAYKFSSEGDGILFSFKIPHTVTGFDIEVHGCSPSPCKLELAYLPYHMMDAVRKTCHSVICLLQVSSPPLGDVQFVEIKYIGSDSQTGTFTVKTRECSRVLTPTQTGCVTLPQLDRIQSMTMFSVLFGYIQNLSVNFTVDAMLAPIIVVPFEVLDPSDIGGTLKWKAKLSGSDKIAPDMTIYICGSVIYNYLLDQPPKADICRDVKDSVREWFGQHEDLELIQYVPYPRAGIWHVVVQASCFYKKNDSTHPCPAQIPLDMHLEIQPCMNSRCNDKGKCLYAQTPDLISFTACKCDAKYQGYACTDDTHAQSGMVQMAGAYLLTISNLFFIPAIIIGIRRHFWVEAFVYFYTMFFSTFYHACDGMRLQKYRLCIMKYDLLQAADFFGSSCSLWFTLIAMACIRHRLCVSILQVVGPFGIFIGVVYDRTSLCVIAVPVLGGLLTIAVSWGLRMYRTKKVYPSWRRYLFFILPGVLMAATGATLFAFLETRDNYKYLHSMWHMSIALSICLLLPSSPAGEKKEELTNVALDSQLLTTLAESQASQSTQPSDETSTSVDVNE